MQHFTPKHPFQAAAKREDRKRLDEWLGQDMLVVRNSPNLYEIHINIKMYKVTKFKEVLNVEYESDCPAFLHNSIALIWRETDG